MPDTLVKAPHPIPYQGSKRSLAPLIGQFVPSEINTWYEPFAGSAAMSLWAARNRNLRHIVVGDSLIPMVELWRSILKSPQSTAIQYAEIWNGQKVGDVIYFNKIRERFNTSRDPVDLLYLLCRCVKNAVRFNAKGLFTQSVDKRRLGMHPKKMRVAIEGAASLLQGRTEIRAGDWLDTLSDAGQKDFIYMDPPYFGTSTGRDRRYAEWMTQERLISELYSLNTRCINFALSYDGMCGEKVYAPKLPSDLHMNLLHLHAGRSSQATLNGGKEETIESLYLSQGLKKPKDNILKLKTNVTNTRQAVLSYLNSTIF